MEYAGDGSGEVMHDVFAVLAEVETCATMSGGCDGLDLVEDEDVEVSNCHVRGKC
jgi:hypothetical protein